MAVVYKHIRADNNIPFYIGIGKSIKRAYNFSSRSKIWKNCMKKHGCIVEILFDDLTYEEAKVKEIEFIKFYGRMNTGTGTLVNLTDGGDGSCGYKPSKEALVKIGIKSKGRIKSPEQIEKWKKSMNFEKSIETKEKIRKSLLGVKHTEERNLKCSQSHIGKKMREESKKKLSLAIKGKSKGPFTEEHIQKLRDSHKGIKQSRETILKRKETIKLNRLFKNSNT